MKNNATGSATVDATWAVTWNAMRVAVVGATGIAAWIDTRNITSDPILEVINVVVWDAMREGGDV